MRTHKLFLLTTAEEVEGDFIGEIWNSFAYLVSSRVCCVEMKATNFISMRFMKGKTY